MTVMNSKMTTGRFTRVILAAVLAGLFARQCCHAQDVVLLLQQSPAESGTVAPEQGIHHFTPGTDVTLTATPNPGYQFVYWLGDVSDPTAAGTIVHMDTPKIVIAIFQRIEYDLIEAVAAISQGAPIGGAFFTAPDIFRQASGAATGPRPVKIHRFVPPTPPPPPDFPVPVPEPATAGLLLAGTFFALARRRART